METAINKIKQRLANEQDTNVRIGIKTALYILQDEYLKSLSPTKAIEVINEYKKEV